MFLDPLGAAPLFDRTKNDGRAFVPTAFHRAAARSGSPGRPSGRRDSALPWTAVSPAARWPRVGAGVLLTLSLVTPAAAQGAGGAVADWRTLVAEASRRFEIPERWIHAVMGVESAYQSRALSHAGAMGLMQVMPATYADLRVRYGLGADPYQPRDNVMAGAAYLREMYDRFGAPGFLAAYNAGPARYLQHVTDGRPLPLETRAYVAKLSPAVTGPGISRVLPPAPEAPPPTIFVSLGASVPRAARHISGIADSPPAPAGSGLFVRLGEGRRSP